MDDSEFRPISAQPSYPIKKDKTKLIIVIIVVLLIVGGFFLFNRSNNSQNDTVTEEKVVIPTKKPSPTPEEEEISPTVAEEEEEPTPSPLPTTGTVSSAKKLNIQVLNGSGTPGIAAEAETFLKGLGYEVIVIGNADNNDFEGVTINIKSSRSSFLDDIKSDLNDKYTVNDETGNLSSSSQFDVTIIIGS